MFSYTKKTDKNNVVSELTVALNKRVIGKIKKVTGGYQYFPNGSKKGGDILPSYGDVQVSIEAVE